MAKNDKPQQTVPVQGAPADSNAQKMSKDEQVGFHKGSLSVLQKEREEMIRIISICEQLMQMHLKALADLGIDIKEQTQASEKKVDVPKKVPIEHLI